MSDQRRPVWLSDADALAQRFHETYERLAPSFGYETRRDSAVPWEDVPETNRWLMAAVAAEILADLRPQAWVTVDDTGHAVRMEHAVDIPCGEHLWIDPRGEQWLTSTAPDDAEPLWRAVPLDPEGGQ